MKRHLRRPAGFALSPLARAISVALACGLSTPGASAQSEAVLQDVVVTATRSSQPSDVVPGTVTTIDAAQIERRQARDIAEVFEDEPDISMTRDPRRFGSGAVNIRGIEDNRVLLLIDGVRAGDYREGGTTNYTTSNRDLPDPDFLKRVEIVRGPASSLYGSEAIGGVVGFLTLDPDDLLTNGRTLALGAKLAHYTESAGTKTTAWAAAGGETLKGLLMISRVETGETENMGSVDVYGFERTLPNPQDNASNNLLGKLVFVPAAGHQFGIGLEHKDSESDTDVRRITNQNPDNPLSLSRIAVNTGHDSVVRDRVVLDYRHAPAAEWYDRLVAKAYWQRHESDNRNYQLRANSRLSAVWGCSATSVGSANCAVDQQAVFEQSHLGTSIVLEKALGGPVPQFLTAGIDWLRTTTEEVKYGSWTNLATGVTSNLLLGEELPRSEFPKGDMDQLGIFIQDDIHFFDGRLRVTPGLRYDDFELKPESGDPLYKPVPGATAVSKSGSRVSPKLALSLEVIPQWHAYASYVEGYRAPNYEQVNRYFLNNQQFYGLIGNPDLEPETSEGFEIGVKAGGRDVSAQVALFWNDYENFIDSVLLSPGDPARLPMPYRSTYQYRNLANVSIHGYELRGQWQALRSLRLSAALASAWGEYESSTAAGTFVPLNSIEPRRLTLAALWTPSANWGAEARLRLARRQDRYDDTAVTLFRTPGYEVVDVGAWWQFHRSARLNLVVNNLFDRKYWLWSDVQNAALPISDPGPDFYTQPGRNLSASVRVDF